MKKIFASCFILLSTFSLFSLNKEKVYNNIDKNTHLTELMVDEDYIKRQKALKEKKRQERESASELYDGVLDVKYHLESYWVLESRYLKVELFGKTGTFNIHRKGVNGNLHTLFAIPDLSSSTGFLFKYGGEVFRLNHSNRVQRELRRLEHGAQLVYTIDNSVRFIIDFSLLSSIKNAPEDVVQIRLFTVSMSQMDYNVDYKGIFDTMLGEVSSVHFKTASELKIRNENILTGEQLKKERAVLVSDGKASFQFVLDGECVSPVKDVIFANTSELYRQNWDVLLRKGRGFSNIRGYDDSALMVEWAGFTIPAQGLHERVFYIASAGYEESPRGLEVAAGRFFYPWDESQLAEDDKSQNENNQGLTVGDVPSLASKTKDDALDKKSMESKDKRTDVEFIVKNIRDYQLDPVYIQDLIDRIDALQSEKKVDRKKVAQLNAELDAILERLRQQ